MIQSHVITLKRGENKERVLYKVQRGHRLRLKLHSSLIGVNAKVFCNYPAVKDTGESQGSGNKCWKTFNRHEYYELPWTFRGKEKVLSEVDGYAEISIELSGSFRYYCSLKESGYAVEVCSGYFVVDPVMHVPCPIAVTGETGFAVGRSAAASNGNDLKRMELDEICMQTVVTKHLGPVEEWLSRLRTSKETAYNMVHFTPVQQLGASNSAYSIRNQLEIDSRYGSGASWHSVKGVVDEMKSSWGVLSITDIVLNHTSYDSPWIHQHPEAGFNMVNSPHLKPAFVLDRVLWNLTLDISAGKYASRGIPDTPVTDETLKSIRSLLLEELLPKYKLWEYFLANVPSLVSTFETKVRNSLDAPARQSSDVSVQLIQDPNYVPLGCKVDFDAAVAKFYVQRPEKCSSYESQLTEAVKEFEKHLEKLNQEKESRIQHFLADAVGNCLANAGYHFLDPNGPRWKKISEVTPIVWRYFTEHPFRTLTPQEEIDQVDVPEVGCHFKACNGWIMGDDPLRNFAEPGSMVYFKRELIVWGDSVKLRFGKSREDSPFLWDHIEKYCVETAATFDGIRLDNCHSTPLHVAEFAVDTCRRVKPDFYVMAELFTGREDIDMIFVNRLGITSLIREAMSAYNCQELGRQIHRYGGRPVGAFYPDSCSPLLPCLPHALFMDYTHDNQPAAVQKRHPVDLLASAAAVGMGCYAIGSSRGYDEMVPHYIDIVNENRLYPKWEETAKTSLGDPMVVADSGIICGKKLLNQLHQLMAQHSNNYDQVYVDQVTDDVITVTRHNSITHQSVIAAIRTAFDPNIRFQDIEHLAHNHRVSSLNIPGEISRIVLEASTVPSKTVGKFSMDNYSRHERVITGLSDWKVHVLSDIQVCDSRMVKTEVVSDSTGVANTKVTLSRFAPGSVVIFSVHMKGESQRAAEQLHRLFNELSPGLILDTFKPNKGSCAATSEGAATLTKYGNLGKLSLVDLNRVLYRCIPEECADGGGGYNLPGFGDMKYCGIAGMKYIMDDAKCHGDNLGHAMFDNLRSGDWLMDYTVSRLKRYGSTQEFADWLESVFGAIKKLPRYLIPAYFECFIRLVYNECVHLATAKLSGLDEVQIDVHHSLKSKLLLGSVQLVGTCKTSSLAPLPTDLVKQLTSGDDGELPSLSAGLPHFSEGIWRNWGRDTFIALRGLLILTGRLNEAKAIILSYAATMRHGLIPNLLGGGEIARFNCRDAFWWWLNSIRSYCCFVSQTEAKKLFLEKVNRLYPTDEALFDKSISSKPHGEVTLASIVEEGLQRHVDGINFVERDAGPKIDENMRQEGFSVKVFVDQETGLVFGGNKWNCGTWMDKMGSSVRAGNKGTPATPRDGATVELQGLMFACVNWLAKAHSQHIFPVGELKLQGGKTWLFSDWADRISAHFQEAFYIGNDGNSSKYNNLELINKKCIYKDTLNSQNPWTDYQLRPNYAIAIAEAPEMCDTDQAWQALQTMQKHLLGPLGMKTLDPSDWKYNGCYDNDRDDGNFDLAKGFNYHNGPEWLWLTGFFWKAKWNMAKARGALDIEETLNLVSAQLARAGEHLDQSPWRGLTELTNKNGEYCSFSSPTQAWSFATLLEILHETIQ